MGKAGRQEAFAGCIPTYRDALVLFNEQGQQGRVLSICFECLYMIIDEKQLLEADFATYAALKETLMQLGHPIGRR